MTHVSDPPNIISHPVFIIWTLVMAIKIKSIVMETKGWSHKNAAMYLVNWIRWLSSASTFSHEYAGVSFAFN